MQNQKTQTQPTPPGDINLYDSSGTPVAVIDSQHPRGLIIFLTNRPYAGKAVAQISGSSIVYGLNGNQIGIYKKEVFYNNENLAIGFTNNTFDGQLKPGPQNFNKYGVPKDYAPNARGFERDPQNPSQNDLSLQEVLKKWRHRKTLILARSNQLSLTSLYLLSSPLSVNSLLIALYTSFH